jgi:hypothetical protein
MMYWIYLQRRRRGQPVGDPYRYYGSFLPGIIPDHVLDMMRCTGWRNEGVELLDICHTCDMDTRCHIIEVGTGRKYCPVLFHDAVQPNWRLEEVL